MASQVVSISQMASHVKVTATSKQSSVDRGGGREALIDAAKKLLHARPASTVTGRELAQAAGVNYGLVHHHFGNKDEVFRQAGLELRAEFLGRHGDLTFPDLIGPDDPFLRAVGISQVDYPGSVVPPERFPAGEALVDAVRDRARRSAHGAISDAEVRARVIALVGLQLASSLYGEMLRDTAGVTDDRDAVDAALSTLYRQIGLIDEPPANSETTTRSTDDHPETP
jgi:AcrR family transcriptional regulator